MDIDNKVVSVLKKSDKPMKAQEVADALGVDKVEVSKAFKELKAEGKIVSPKACYYTVAQ
ncbi:MAG: HTH domain-containing protein [Coriobacteriia bacterium]|nr:HTH domain-containing protein [Coriobacteriia bacterium]